MSFGDTRESTQACARRTCLDLSCRLRLSMFRADAAVVAATRKHCRLFESLATALTKYGSRQDIGRSDMHGFWIFTSIPSISQKMVFKAPGASPDVACSAQHVCRRERNWHSVYKDFRNWLGGFSQELCLTSEQHELPCNALISCSRLVYGLI